jgi:acyl-CoA reductase-like NAD-dependent aldehyde dehydrogenase
LAEAGQVFKYSKRIAKLHLLVRIETGRKYHNAAENIIPVTMELGGNLQIFSSICSFKMTNSLVKL